MLISPDAVEQWAIKKGYYVPPDENTDEEEAKSRAMDLGSSWRCLPKLVAGDRRYHDVKYEVADYDTDALLLVFYTNYSSRRRKLTEEEEKAAVELLQRELGLTQEQATPKWYYVCTPIENW